MKGWQGLPPPKQHYEPSPTKDDILEQLSNVIKLLGGVIEDVQELSVNEPTHEPLKTVNIKTQSIYYLYS